MAALSQASAVQGALETYHVSGSESAKLAICWSNPGCRVSVESPECQLSAELNSMLGSYMYGNWHPTHHNPPKQHSEGDISPTTDPNKIISFAQGSPCHGLYYCIRHRLIRRFGGFPALNSHWKCQKNRFFGWTFWKVVKDTIFSHAVLSIKVGNQ